MVVCSVSKVFQRHETNGTGQTIMCSVVFKLCPLTSMPFSYNRAHLAFVNEALSIQAKNNYYGTYPTQKSACWFLLIYRSVFWWLVLCVLTNWYAIREKHCLVLFVNLNGDRLVLSTALDRMNLFIIVAPLYISGVSQNIPHATFVAKPDHPHGYQQWCYYVIVWTANEKLCASNLCVYLSTLYVITMHINMHILWFMLDIFFNIQS